MNRYVAYLNTYYNRPCTAQFLWWYYYLIDHMPNTFLITNRDYHNVDKNRWEYRDYVKAPYKYSDPANLSPRYFYSMEGRFDEYGSVKNLETPTQLLYASIHTPIPTIVQEILTNVFDNPDNKDITAGISWVNNASFDEACRIVGIPSIHNESGALRSPFFLDSCYFDFSGVNGNTEFDKRFELFKKIANKVKIYSREELLQLISKPHQRDYVISKSKESPKYECGVAMQVDIDTNVLAFNRGVSETDVINMAAKDFNNSLIIRNHPLSSIGYIRPASLGLGQIDTSKDSLEFIGKCKRIYTLNSSVAFEALLLGREVKVFGDNPFRNLQFMDEEELTLALNFSVFSYLIPLSKLYDDEYYSMRIRCKEEEYLYNKGQEYWLK